MLQPSLSSDGYSQHESASSEKHVNEGEVVVCLLGLLREKKACLNHIYANTS